MTNYQWVGASSTSASTATNWVPNGTPAAGDVIIFDAGSTQDCDWDIALPASAFSVDEIIVESSFNHTLNLTVNMRVKGLFLNGTIAPGAGTKIIFKHGSSPNFFGSYKTYNERFVLIGDSGNATGITFDMIGSSSPVTKFDDGTHPTVNLSTGRFAPDYVAPTGTSGKATFDSFTVASPTDFSPGGNLSDNDRLKVFSFTAFSITSTSIDFGLSTAEFTATSGGFNLPIAGATGMPTGFVAYYRKIVLKANTAGHKVLISDNTYISVEEFEIGDGVVLRGPVDNGDQGADIRSIKTPKIRGTWSFSQVSPGIYRSPRNASGPMPKVNGNFHITGKLDVDGLIDPTGLELTPVASNPGGTAANTLWLNSGDSNKLYHGSSEVAGGGGGGSGTVTSVATSAPITGGTITGSGTIGISAATTSAAGSMSAADKTKLDGIEANADVTDATNVTAAGALMDSEVTNLAQVKAFNSADYATAAQGVKADSAIQSVLPITLDTNNNRVGINKTSPGHILHAKDTGTMDFPFRLECNGGNLRLNKFGHLQIQNENTHSDADSFDSPFWQLGQRDGGQLDLAFGTPSGSNAFVGTTRSFVTFKSASNSATGAKEIGFYGTSTTAQQAAPAAPPTGPAANTDLNAIAIGEIITVLQNLGLIS
tara:strand:+ start:60 stop:2018 length:1959 start_codon:yes stop_codon:yes gene_type:complete